MGVQATYKALSADLFWRQGSRVHFWMEGPPGYQAAQESVGFEVSRPVFTHQLCHFPAMRSWHFHTVKVSFLVSSKGGGHTIPLIGGWRVIQLEQSSAECLTYYCHSCPCHCHHPSLLELTHQLEPDKALQGRWFRTEVGKLWPSGQRLAHLLLL